MPVSAAAALATLKMTDEWMFCSEYLQYAVHNSVHFFTKFKDFQLERPLARAPPGRDQVASHRPSKSILRQARDTGCP